MRFSFVSFITVTLIATIGTATTPAAGPGPLFDAIRLDDPAAVAASAVQSEINGPDETGATPLMHAVIYARPAIADLLLARGADVNAANKYGSTALMWAAARTDLVKLLLSRGANVHAAASDGTTAFEAAARLRNFESMDALIAAGANLKDPVVRRRLLRVAFSVPEPTLRTYLAARGITPESAADFAGAPVLGRLITDPPVLKRLLALGVDPHEEVPLITLSLPTYFIAARHGNLDTMRMLENAGVDPKSSGARGWTALMLAAGDESVSIPVLRHLVEKGVDVNARDDEGRTALDWALTRGETPASQFLRAAGGRTGAVVPVPTRSTGPYSRREAVSRAVARLQPAGPAFSDRARCNSCHNQNLPDIAIRTARTRGVAVDASLVDHPLAVTQQNWRGRRETALLGETALAGFQLNVSYGLFSMAETGAPSTPITDAMVLGLASRQIADGSWPPGSDIRPPLTATPIVTTALALRGIREFTPPGRRDEMEKRLRRGADFLRQAKPADTQEQAFKLLGLVWAGATREEIARERTALIALQRADGGWAQLPSMQPDAYATGQSLFALHASGIPTSDTAYRRGTEYLLRTQLEDGTWFVRTRAFGFQPYFETGFPHGRSQFISTAATAWATTVLAYSLERDDVQ